MISQERSENQWTSTIYLPKPIYNKWSPKLPRQWHHHNSSKIENDGGHPNLQLCSNTKKSKVNHLPRPHFVVQYWKSTTIRKWHPLKWKLTFFRLWLKLCTFFEKRLLHIIQPIHSSLCLGGTAATTASIAFSLPPQRDLLQAISTISFNVLYLFFTKTSCPEIQKHPFPWTNTGFLV